MCYVKEDNRFFFLELNLMVKGKSLHLCQCFMETCTRDLAKATTNKAYQEKVRDLVWKNEKIYSQYSNELINLNTMNELI
jgi:hypothetical protein